MVLDQPFTVETSEGMTADLKSAQIDMGVGTVTTTEPVTIRNTQSSVVAKSMQILDKGRSIVFENEVRMIIEPGAMDRKPGTTKPGTGN
jgi:lipopolysaccharide export system protein LptC